MEATRANAGHPWKLAAIVAVSLGVVPAVVAQFVPPLHVPIHEYTQLFVLVGAFVQLNLSAVLIRRTQPASNRANRVLWLSIAAVGIAGLSTLGVHSLANSWLHHCDTAWTASYFWIVWLPVGALMSVLGVHAGEVGWGWKCRIGLCLVLIVIGLTHDVAQLTAGVRVFDLFLGEPLGFFQRSSMADIQPIHFLNRAWLLWTAAACWGLSLALRGSGRMLLAIFGAGWLLLTIFGGSQIGVGPGRGRLESMLDHAYETPHFVFRTAAHGSARFRMEAAGRRAEWIYSKLAPACGVDSSARVEIAVFDAFRELEDATGKSSAHAYYRWIRLNAYQLNTETLTHELVHALCTPNRWRLLWHDRAIVEGSATAWEGGMAESAWAHAEAAGVLRAGLLPAISVVAGEFGFSRIDEHNAYRTAGSFVGFLVLSHGLERFRDLQRTQNFETTYGATLQALEAEWHAFLRELPDDLEQTAAGRARFDPIRVEGFFDKPCPKLRSCRLPAQAEAAAKLQAGDLGGAERIYRGLAAEDPLRWTASWIGTLQRLERYEEALGAIDGFLRLDIGDDQRLVMLNALASVQMASGRWPELETTFAARAALTGEVSAEQSAIEELVGDPKIREPVAAILLAGEDAWSRFLARAELLELNRDHPDNRALAFLAASWTRVSYPYRPTPTTLRLLEQDMAGIIETPGACDPVADHLAAIAHAFFDANELDKAANLVAAMDSACIAPRSRWVVADAKRRLEWERTQLSEGAIPDGAAP